MPELPEVELVRRYIEEHAVRKKIEHVRILDPRILGDPTPTALPRRVEGQTVRRVRRWGKNLFLQAGTTWLHLHLGMTGDFEFYSGDDDPRFSKVVFDFRGGRHLAFTDPRLFGVAELSADPETYVEEHGLGADPLESPFRLADFRRDLTRRKGAIKPLLMSQEVVAGLGNLYVDETLFQIGMLPLRTVDDIEPAEVTAMHRTIRRIMTEVLRRKERDLGYPPRYLIVRREAGERCPKCGGTIKRSTVGGRTTYFCGKHQK